MTDNNQVTTVQADGLHFIFHPNFYGISKANEIFEQLKSIQYNSDESSQVFIHGSWKNIPRKQVAFGNPNLTYNFAGTNVHAEKWPLFLKEIRDELQQYLVNNNILPSNEYQINYVLVNLYRDGHDYIGAHSDNERDLDVINGENIILSLSFGATRDFIFHNKSNTSVKYELPLHHGDLLIMRGETQKKWRHSLPKRLKVKEPRINLTFRFMKEKR